MLTSPDDDLDEVFESVPDREPLDFHERAYTDWSIYEDMGVDSDD